MDLFYSFLSLHPGKFITYLGVVTFTQILSLGVVPLLLTRIVAGQPRLPALLTTLIVLAGLYVAHGYLTQLLIPKYQEHIRQCLPQVAGLADESSTLALGLLNHTYPLLLATVGALVYLASKSMLLLAVGVITVVVASTTAGLQARSVVRSHRECKTNTGSEELLRAAYHRDSLLGGTTKLALTIGLAAVLLVGRNLARQQWYSLLASGLLGLSYFFEKIDAGLTVPCRQVGFCSALS